MKFRLFVGSLLMCSVVSLGAVAEAGPALAVGTCNPMLVTGNAEALGRMASFSKTIHVPYMETAPIVVSISTASVACRNALFLGCQAHNKAQLGWLMTRYGAANFRWLADRPGSALSENLIVPKACLALDSEYAKSIREFQPLTDDQVHDLVDDLNLNFLPVETARRWYYPYALSGLALQLAKNLSEGMQLGLLELRENRMKLIVSGVAVATLTDLATAGALRSLGWRLVSTSKGNIVVLAATALAFPILGFAYPNQEIRDRPWLYADLDEGTRRKIEERHPEVVEIVAEFNEDLEELLKATE